MEDLLYLLAGFDTSSTFLIDSPPSISSSSHDLSCLLPFEFLIFKVREFYRVEAFDSFVQGYLRRLASLKDKVASIEELFVSLQEEFQLFKDLDRIYSTALKSPSDFPFSTNKKSLAHVNASVLRTFQSRETAVTLSCINKWINQADPTVLVEVKVPEEFTTSHWKDMFRIKPISLGKMQLEGIETAGKVVFFARMLFGIEVVEDAPPGSSLSSSYAVKRKLPPKSPIKKLGLQETQCHGPDPPGCENEGCTAGLEKESVGQPRDGLCTRIESVRFDDPVGLRPFSYKGDIAPRRAELSSVLSRLMAIQVVAELGLIQDIVLMQNGTFFGGLFETFERSLFGSSAVVRELNEYYRESVFSEPGTEDPGRFRRRTKIGHRAFENAGVIAFEQCDSSLGEYIMKLLKFQRMPQENQFLINIQRIGISFGDGLLQYFIPKKSYFEMEILFRFLFSIHSSVYYLQRARRYNFTRILWLIFVKVGSESLVFLPEFFNERYAEEAKRHAEECDCPSCESHGFSIDGFPQQFSGIIAGFLNRFYITNSEVFSVWTRMIDVCLEYLQIEYKDHVVESEYDRQVKSCVADLIDQISRNYGECEFTDFLKNLEVEKCL